jgi:hypothetical protein
LTSPAFAATVPDSSSSAPPSQRLAEVDLQVYRQDCPSGGCAQPAGASAAATAIRTMVVALEGRVSESMKILWC